MKAFLVALSALLFSLAVTASQNLEASIVELMFELRSGEQVRIRIDADKSLESVSLRDGKEQVKVTNVEFGVIENVVLNGVKIYADASLRADGSFDHYVFIKIPFSSDRTSNCYFETNSKFPHGCDVATIFFKNAKFAKNQFGISRPDR